jgi:hypothetical protein
MRRTYFHLVMLLSLTCLSMQAQARPGCEVVPKTIAGMQGCFRPLLVFSPNPTDPRLGRQAKLLDGDADDMMDRFVLYTPIAPDPKAIAAPLDAPYTVLDPLQMQFIRSRFHIPQDRFTVLLLEENGSVMLRSPAPVDPDHLNALIDQLPSRQQEMQRPHAN